VLDLRKKEGNVMLSKHARLGILLLTGMLFLAPMTAQAGTQGIVKGQSRAASTSATRESLLQTFWRGLTRLLEKDGSSIIPGGGTGTGSSGTSDEGTGLDPFGLPHNG
jgi:hypothetical protein